MSNLGLWDKVRTPDPKHTKSFNRGGGFKGTATNTQYMIQVATEIFGENGKGWGFVIDNEDYIVGHKIMRGDIELGNQVVHVIRGHAWYMQDGVKYETSQQFGQTTFVGSNKNGMFTDEEAPKKSVTDMMLKCLSLLGFSADIFLGRWDDNKYVNEVKEQFKEPVKLIEGEQKSVIISLVNETETDITKFLSWLGCKGFDDMPLSKAKQAISMLEGKLK